ncbi:hypothetical protein ABN763_16385 [Spongiivirga sp. MCCC 1A20706]|uniref:hypothetical protein n=1 Tax=Spongiivirga sp. MCCC 1A20706 TaxID=3160963 RepID=UPI003977642C
MKKEMIFFQNEGFEITVVNDRFFWTKRKGRNALLLKFVDFYFLKEVDFIDVQAIHSFHERSIKTANQDFKLPRSLRLTIPNVNSVLITSNEPSKGVIEYVQKRNKSILGGQQDTVFLIDKEVARLYSPGLDITTIHGEAKVLWGDQKEFKKLNGHNRAYYFINAMIHNLYVS